VRLGWKSNQKPNARASSTTAGKQARKKKAQITLGCGFTHISVAERSPTVYNCWSAVRIAVCVKQKKTVVCQLREENNKFAQETLTGSVNQSINRLGADP
jgi:hypothetical protein